MSDGIKAGEIDQKEEEWKMKRVSLWKSFSRTAGILESRNYEASRSHCDLRPKSGIGLRVYTIKYFRTGH